jgi:hypothetical protein
MKTQRNGGRLFFGLYILGIFGLYSATAQDLDPRAYIRLPIKTTTLISGVGYSFGNVVMDPSISIKNVKADVQFASVGVARSFKFAGLTAQAMAVLPYSWAEVSGEVNEQAQKITRSGFADARIRLSVLFLGAPALTVEEFKKTPPAKTILGASINISAPTGQFFSDKLINLGTNRWGFRPELALSQHVGKRWLIDVYAGVWLFTENNHFYPGESVRGQEPMGAFQAHFSYNIKPNLWVAYDATYYTGGASTVNGVMNDDRQANFRGGFTAVFPTGKFSSLKFAVSKGAIVRIGQDFTSFSLGWQRTWFKMK